MVEESTVISRNLQKTEIDKNKVESEKWTALDLDTGILVDHLHLDYYLGRQPDAGKYYLL